MKKRLVFHIITLILLMACCGTVTYAWWVGGISANKLIIQSANISSKITMYKGVDFNHDGALDIDDNGNYIYEEPETSEGEEHEIILKMVDLIPTEIYTWKVNAENKGDANGYLVISVSLDDITVKDYYKYLSIIVIYKDSDNNNIVSDKVYLGANPSMLYEDVNYIPKNNGSREYLFKLQLETFDNLVKAGIFEDTEENRTKYQSLQGTSVQMLLLDITLTTAKPQI